MRSNIRKVFLLWKVKPMMLLAIVLCAAFVLFAMQMIYAPTMRRIEDVEKGVSVSSFLIDFHNRSNGISKAERQILKELFAKDKALAGCVVDSGFYCRISDDEPCILGIMNGGNSKWYIQAEGRYFTGEEEQGKKVAIISQYKYDYDDFNYENHTVNIDGFIYKFVGLCYFNWGYLFFQGQEETAVYESISREKQLEEALMSVDYEDELLLAQYERVNHAILIPAKTFEDANMSVDVVVMSFDRMSLQQRSNVKKELGGLFPDANVVQPELAQTSFSEKNKRNLCIGVGMALGSLCFLCMLFQNWLKECMPVMNCYFRVGASYKQLIYILYGSWIAVYVISYLLSCVIGWMVDLILRKYWMTVKLLLGIHAGIFLSVLAITFAMTLPCTRVVRKK
ncbi:MAG: hypothetical protein Q4E13_05965 [Clostridia bacterium]|nr:hypothetical protein [Clostridia bacterium]